MPRRFRTLANGVVSAAGLPFLLFLFFGQAKKRKPLPQGDRDRGLQPDSNNVATTPATFGVTANISILLGFVPHPNLRVAFFQRCGAATGRVLFFGQAKKRMPLPQGDRDRGLQPDSNNVATTPATLGATANISILLGVRASPQPTGRLFSAVWRNHMAGSFLWASKEKKAPPAGRQRSGIATRQLKTMLRRLPLPLGQQQTYRYCWGSCLTPTYGSPFFSGVAQPHGGFFYLGKQRKESPSRRETETGDCNQTVENNVATTPATFGATANISILLGFAPHPNIRAADFSSPRSSKRRNRKTTPGQTNNPQTAVPTPHPRPGGPP